MWAKGDIVVVGGKEWAHVHTSHPPPLQSDTCVLHAGVNPTPPPPFHTSPTLATHLLAGRALVHKLHACVALARHLVPPERPLVQAMHTT